MILYGKGFAVPIEFIVPSLRIATFTSMDDSSAKEEHMSQLLELEEDKFIAGFQQQVQKAREKA